MKIKLSKNQWETMGKRAGWIKEAAVTQQFPATLNMYGAGNAMAKGQFPFTLGIEVNIGGNTHEVSISEKNPEVQELYQSIAAQQPQSQPQQPQQQAVQ
jgi:hypothetical protein